MITVRPTRVTDRPGDHLRIYRALGARVLGDPAASRVVLQFGAGRLVLEASAPGRRAGLTLLGFDVDDGAVPAEPAIPVEAAPIPAPDPAGDLVLFPIRFDPDVPAAVAALASLGGRPALAWKDGGYTEVAFDRGWVAVHAAEEGSTGLSFETEGDLEALRERLAAVGVDAPIIDETFGRGLRIPDPDGTAAEIWVNTRQDTYGYVPAG